MEGVSDPLISYSQEGPLSGFTWRQITDPEATAVEGAHMKHSVGGYSKNGMYGPAKQKLFKQGVDRVYTLRDPQGLPVVTVSVEQTAKGPVVLQTKAKQNTTVPEVYGQPLVDLFEKLNVSQIAEKNDFLPSLAKAYQKQKDDEIFGIRQIAAREPPVPQQVPLPPARQPAPVPRPAPVQEGIGQINARPDINPAHLDEQLQRLAQDPQAIRQQLRRPRGIMDYFQRYMMLRRRMMEDDDRGPEGEE